MRIAQLLTVAAIVPALAAARAGAQQPTMPLSSDHRPARARDVRHDRRLRNRDGRVDRRLDRDARRDRADLRRDRRGARP